MVKICSTRNGIPSGFLFRGMVRNGIPRVCYYFCFTEWNSELFSLPCKCSERNSASMLLFLIHGTEFRVVFSSAEGFGTEFREFLFRGTAGIPSEITFVPSIPSSAELFFCRKFPTLLVTAKWIGDYFEIRRCGAKCSVRFSDFVLNKKQNNFLIFPWFRPLMAMPIKLGAQIMNHIWSRRFFSYSGRFSFYAPNIRCANKLER
jgi:hypothetical protein